LALSFALLCFQIVIPYGPERDLWCYAACELGGIVSHNSYDKGVWVLELLRLVQ